MSTKHKHHIIPRYMGGSDDPSNIVELTVEEHALAHLELYEKHGNQEDLLAYKGLSGRISKEDWIIERSSFGGKKANDKRRKENKLPAFMRDPVKRLENCKKGGFEAGQKNRGKKWWFDGKTYKRSEKCPGKDFKVSGAPNNPGALTKNTIWWNNGNTHKRSSFCPGNEWVKGRINKNGTLGGKRIKI